VRKEANKNVLIIIITALLLFGHQRLRCCSHRHSNQSRNKTHKSEGHGTWTRQWKFIHLFKLLQKKKQQNFH